MKKLFLLAATALGLAASPSLAIVNAPLPANAYISFGGLDWAWASPCSPTGCSDGNDVLDLSYQGTLGWRLPTAAELAAGPSPADFIFAGANVPGGGASVDGTIFTGAPGDGACAAAYFTLPFYNQCNYNDALIGAIYGNPAWAGEPNVETWVVRGEVPEPASWAMMLIGFGVIGGVMRRRGASPIVTA